MATGSTDWPLAPIVQALITAIANTGSSTAAWVARSPRLSGPDLSHHDLPSSAIAKPSTSRFCRTRAAPYGY
jgi:hypothetical protein